MTFTFDKWTLVSSRNHKNNEKIKYNYKVSTLQLSKTSFSQQEYEEIIHDFS